MRKVNLPPGAPQYQQGDEPHEEIIEASIGNNGMIRAFVAFGHNVNGQFVQLSNPPAQQYIIMYEDYAELKASIEADEPQKGRPKGAFFIDDLWPYIDKCRTQRDAASLKEIAMNRQNNAL